MALNFPANPVDGQAFGNYTYNSSKGVWSASATPPRYTVSANVPAAAANGDVWFNSETARSYIYYEDSDSSQWVEIGGSEGATGVVASLGAIPGVDLTGLEDGKTLVYDAANSEWIPGEAGGKFTVSDTAPLSAENGDTWFKSDDGKTYIYYVDADGGQWVEIASNTTGYLDIGQLNDVTIVSPTTGQALTYDGANWVNATPASTLDSLTDVDTTGVVDGQALVYDSATSEWVPGSAAPSGVNVLASDTINVDFSDNVPLETRTVAGNVTFSASTYLAGASKKISITNNTGAPVLVSFPAEWYFITDKPAKIGDGVTNILELESFSNAASGITARWYGPIGFSPYTASGGSESTVTDNGVTYKVHTFTTGGVFTISELSEETTVEALVVAGGGGGGNINYSGSTNRAAGGGAGGVIYIPNYIMDATGNYTITVGAGAANFANGSNSSISGGGRQITALGGGRGGAGDGTDNATDGGSGGGNWYPGYAGANPTQGSTTSDTQTSYPNTGFGNAGGTSGSTQPYGAGGGGAGEVGGSFNGPDGPVGGDGIAVSISGTSTYYGGGGSSAGYSDPAYASGAYLGGLGGGGIGYNLSFNSASNGLSSTGGGGGSGGAGGSGIVIIRYPITNPN